MKSSPFLLSANINNRQQMYVKIFLKPLKIFNASLYVDDFITSLPNVDNAFKITKEAFEVFQEACMTYYKLLQLNSR